MASLYFKIASNWEEVVRLRDEISKLEAQLKKLDVNKSPGAVAALETQLASARQEMTGMVDEAAKAGAIMENDFKKKIFDASQVVNGLSEKITLQRGTIQQLKNELAGLKERYRDVLKSDGDTSGLEVQIKATNAKLREQKDVLFNLTQEQAGARLSVKKLRDEYDLFKQDAGGVSDEIGNIAGSMKGWIATIAGGIGLKEFIGKMVQVRGEFQAADTAIQTLLGSKEKADALMEKVRDYAKISPLEFSDVTQATQMMLGFNIEAEKIPRYLSAIGDVSMGDTQKFNSLTLAFSQMSAAGKLMGQDLNQMINAGFNPLQQISEKTGKSIATLKEEMSKGAISAEMVQQAFIDATSAGGRFYQMSENASKTINGQLSMMQDALDAAFNEMGQASEGVIIKGIGLTTSLIKNYETIGKVLVGLIATYGAYKAAVITNITLTQGWAAAAKADAVAKGIQTAATKVATIATHAFNAALKVNPLILFASAIVGIGTSMLLFRKRTDEASAAQKALESVNKRTSDEYSRQSAIVERLNGVLKSETASIDQKKKALTDLKGIIPDYNASLDKEGKLVNSNTEAIKEYLVQLEKQIKLKAAQEELEELYRQKRLQEKQQKTASEEYNKAQTLYNTSTTLTNSALQNKGINTGVAVFAQNNAVNNQLQSNARNAKKELDEVNKKLAETQSAISAIEKEIEDTTVSATSKKAEAKNKKYWEDKKKEAEAARDALDISKKNSEEWNKYTKQIEEAQEQINKYSASNSEKEVKQENAITSQNAKITELERKQSEERIRQQVDLANQAEQAEIDALDDGYEKTRRQRELNNKKELDAIERQKEDYKRKVIQAQKEIFDAHEELKAKQNPKYKKQTFDPNSVSVDTSAFDKMKSDTENKQRKDKENAEKEAQERYLKNYGTFMQKRQAIVDEYNRKIAQAETQGDKDILQKEMEEALSSLDLEKLKQGINWELIFGDLDKVSKESLEKVKQQLKDFKDSEEYKNMAVDQKKVIDEALSNIQSTLIDKGGLLADLPEQLSELAKAQEELSQAQEEYNEAMRSGTDEQKEAATKKLNDAQKRQQNAQVNVQKSTDKTTSNLVTLSNVITQLGSNSEISLSQVGDLAGNIVDIFAEESEKLGGIIGAAFSLLDAIGTQGLDGFVSNIFSSVFKSVGGIWDTLTFGGFSKLFGIGGNEKEVQDTINRLTDRNEKLQSAIESLTEEMKSSKGSEKSVAEYNKAIKYQEEYNKNVLAKAEANAGYHSSHHSWAYYMGWSESDIQWIRENVMAEFTGTDSLWQMSPEQMDLLRQNVDLWQKMADSGKGGYGNSVVDALGEYADLAGNLEELKEGLFEQLTGISFDSMYDSFIDTLMDMDASAEDFADNLSEYFMRAMLSDKIGNMYSQKLEDWWNRFGESMKDGNLSESERNSLQNEYMGYVNEALKLRDELAAATGYDKAGNSSQQSASSRGFGTEMTHEDAGELSGRFTAVYESNLRIETAEQQQTVAITELRGSIGSLTSQVTGLYNIADETRTILANSYLELQQIRENTENSAKYLKDIKADIAEVKRNTSRL